MSVYCSGEMASSLPLVLFFLCYAGAAQNFQEVSVCPRNADTWKIESDKKNCQGDTPDYLCAAIENNVGKFGEICTKYGLSPERKCAVLNNQTHNLDSVDCKAPTGCPLTPYNPSELWRYPICYQDFYGTSPAPPTTTTTTVQTTAPPVSGPKDEDGGSGSAVGIVMALLILVAVVVVLLVVFYKRNMFGFKDKMEPLVDNFRNHLPGNREDDTRPSGRTDEETGVADDTVKPLLPGNEAAVNGSEKQKEDDKKINIWKLNILQKYLIHILKKEIDVKDLKEKSVIYSKSLKEHFNEPVLQALNGVEKAEDYSKLDMSLVFALLRNFCGNIKKPSRGWNYEPPNNEITIGADIERIQSMWNKYCDTCNNFDFKTLDEVFQRMKKLYGTEAVHVGEESHKPGVLTEEFEEVKEKIQSITLNPDCTLENGIVITESITAALKILETADLVICKGAFGCGKTYALKAILQKYEEIGWKSWWLEETIPTDCEKLEEKTIVICDNLFGGFGCSVFSSDKVSKTETLLQNKWKLGKIKFAVGIHQHVFDEVKRNAQMSIMQNKNTLVDLDRQRESEMLLVFKQQQEKGHCKTDLNCWFRNVDFTSVIQKLSKNQGHIGSPLLSLMYCHQHDFFSDEGFTTSTLQTLKGYFEKMRNTIAYSNFIYLMCIRKQNLNETLPEWAGQLDANLDKDALLKTAAQFPGFIKREDNDITLAHEVLTVALFKTATNFDEILLPVVKYCDIDILVQLMRPRRDCHNEFNCEFEFPTENKNNRHREISKELVKRFVNKCKMEEKILKQVPKGTAHPLERSKFFTDKFERYMKKEKKN